MSSNNKLSQPGEQDIEFDITCVCRCTLCTVHSQLLCLITCTNVHIASQMWCLARALPFLIGDKIIEGDKRWENFLQLLSIVDYSFSPVLTRYLGMMIEDFLTDFKELYNRRIIPKMHYMVHFPSWIKKWVNTSIKFYYYKRERTLLLIIKVYMYYYPFQMLTYMYIHISNPYSKQSTPCISLTIFTVLLTCFASYMQVWTIGTYVVYAIRVIARIL